MNFCADCLRGILHNQSNPSVFPRKGLKRKSRRKAEGFLRNWSGKPGFFGLCPKKCALGQLGKSKCSNLGRSSFFPVFQGMFRICSPYLCLRRVSGVIGMLVFLPFWHWFSAHHAQKP
jgi:hypothetical protein